MFRQLPSTCDHETPNMSIVIRTIALLSLASLIASCSQPPPGWQVEQRLGPEQFGMDPDQPIARSIIGATARPVLGLVGEELHTEQIGIPLEDGVAQFPIQIAPDDIRRANLSIQTFAAGLASSDNTIAKGLQDKVFWRRIEKGWSIQPDQDGYRVIIRDERGRGAEGLINARLFLTTPAPSELRSYGFAIPAQSELQFHFGSTPTAGAVPDPPLRYQADLTCDGRSGTALLGEGRVDSQPGTGWRSARVAVPQGGEKCELSLRVTDQEGQPSTRGLWAWPEVRTRSLQQGRQPNVLLICLDTLRADHMSGYGYPRQTTPAIDDRLMDEGTTFLDVFSTFPQTDVSHLSLFTGLYPDAQPVRGRLRPGSPVTTMAESLQAAGYQTDAITENALVSGLFGFWRGFDAFTEQSVVSEKLGPVSFARAEEYLKKNVDQQFFLFLHTYQTHDPYDSSPEYDAMFRNDNHWNNGGPAPYVPDPQQKHVDRYDRTIREADSLVEQILDTLDETGLSKNTLVILLSDHGESFGEHSLPGHGFAFHDEQLRIPLILRGPGIPEGVEVAGSASLTDVAPTLLELLQLPGLPQGQGRSLRDAIFGTPIAPNREVYFSWHQKGALGARNQSWKSIYSDEETRNYPLETDPFEWHTIKQPTLPPDRQAIIEAHRRESAKIREELTGKDRGNSMDDQAIPQRMEESLRALGYLN